MVTSVARPRVLVFGLAAYAVLSLISMATMSIGAALFLLCLLGSIGSVPTFFKTLSSEVRSEPMVRRFAAISFAFALVCFLSLVVARFWPLSFGGKFSQVHLLKDSAKL